jgi:hypothetical protein
MADDNYFRGVDTGVNLNDLMTDLVAILLLLLYQDTLFLEKRLSVFLNASIFGGLQFVQVIGLPYLLATLMSHPVSGIFILEHPMDMKSERLHI